MTIPLSQCGHFNQVEPSKRSHFLIVKGRATQTNVNQHCLILSFCHKYLVWVPNFFFMIKSIDVIVRQVFQIYKKITMGAFEKTLNVSYIAKSNLTHNTHNPKYYVV